MRKEKNVCEAAPTKEHENKPWKPLYSLGLLDNLFACKKEISGCTAVWGFIKILEMDYSYIRKLKNKFWNLLL